MKALVWPYFLTLSLPNMVQTHLRRTMLFCHIPTAWLPWGYFSLLLLTPCLPVIFPTRPLATGMNSLCITAMISSLCPIILSQTSKAFFEDKAKFAIRKEKLFPSYILEGSKKQNPSGFCEINNAWDIRPQGILCDTSDRDVNTWQTSPKPRQGFSTASLDSESLR